ncbi:hypothetical protein DERP_011144 [Dermatophagoides pteronyssinus]|uniref:Uncharacterized protein n=1 Tax=Dermatophagoides pteronyssinus TaxID=6956 RepID=A0ABQ8J8Z8_DERPT|nr:hypothetical protein DERP_011144 [Dermatophagoides pteronyssinus]
MNFKSIFMNEVDYIHTCDPLTIKMKLQYEYLFEFSEVKHVATLLNNYCLLNINYSIRENVSNYEVVDDDNEDYDNKDFQFIPPPMPRIGGQSSSKYH